MFVKEISEFLRTYKLYVVPGIFLLFGFASPILTKLLPEIMGSMMEEMGMTLPEMTWVDSYDQLFNNLTQIGVIAIILTTMGTIVDEKNKGISQLILTKPVTRLSYILAKFFANLLLIGVSTFLAFFAAWFYTEILFEGNQFMPGFTATTLYFVYVAVILALTIFSSAVAKSTVAAGGIAVLGFIAVSIAPMLGKLLNKYSPAALLDYGHQGFIAAVNPTDIWWTVLVAIGVIISLLAGAAFIFKKQEI